MTERIKWIDIIKGLLLLLICFSHFGDLPILIKYLTAPTASYWVPLFFILSGFLFSKNKYPIFYDYLKAKSKTLLRPYLIFLLIFIILDWNTYTTLNGFTNNIYNIFIYGGPMKASPLWFVWVLFTASLLSYLIIIMAKGWKRIFIITLLSIYSLLLSAYNVTLPFLIHIIPSACIFIIAGYYLCSIIKHSQNWSILKYTLITFFSFIGGIVGIFFPLGDFHLNKIESYPMFYFSPILFGLFCSLCLSKLDNRIKDDNLFSNIAIWIAQNGIIILAFHCYLIIILDIIYNKINFPQDITVYFICKFCFVFMFLYTLIVPFINNYLYRFLGKRQIYWKSNYKL